MPQNKDSLARSERDGRDGQKRSHGKPTGRTPHESAGRRPRDLESGVDYKSAHARTTVKPTSGRATGLDQAAMASDRPKDRIALNAIRVVPYRIEDPDSSDDSSDAGTDSSTTDTSSASFYFPPPSPYDGRADRHAFDLWETQVKHWAECNELSDEEVMCFFLPLVSGKAKACFMSNFVAPSRYLPPKKQTLDEILKVIHEECFPPGYKRMLLQELVSATQGNLGVREFAHELRSRAKRLPYIGDQFLAAMFFEGVHKYIRVRLVVDGMEGDSTDFETLVKYASKYEDDRRMVRAVLKKETARPSSYHNKVRV